MMHMINPARPKHMKPAVVQHGVAHGTPAFRQIHALAMGGSAAAGGRRRKKKASPSRAPAHSKSASARRSRGRKSSSRVSRRSVPRGKAHMVKGSSAARRHMARLRAMRGKKAA